MTPLKQFEVWFVTGSQDLYGPETLKKVAEHSKEIAGFFNASSKIPVTVVFKPVMTGPDEIGALCIEANSTKTCIGVMTWCHTFSPSKMWINGLKILRKPLAASAYAVQPGPALGRNRHGLHEPQPVGARRPRARVHHDAHAHRTQGRGRPLAGRGRAGTASAFGRVRLLRWHDFQTDEGRALRRQHARGRCDRRRQGRGADQVRYVGQQLRRGRSRQGASTQCRDAEIDTLVREYADATRMAAGVRAGRRAASNVRDAGADRTRHAALPRRGRLQGASPPPSRICTAWRSCPDWPCSA